MQEEDADAMSFENQLPTFLMKNCDKIAKQEGFDTYKVEAKKLSTDGISYLAELYEVDIKTVDTNEEEKEINLFIKNAAPIGGMLSEFFSVKQIFSAEYLAYNDISDAFTRLQNEANIPLEDRYKFVKVYGETTTDAIILENVAKKGFQILTDREKVIPLEYAELCLQEMAKFHALGFAIKEKLPEFFKSKISTIQSNGLTFNKKWKDAVDKWSDITSKSLSSTSKSKIQLFKPYIFKKWPEYFSGLNCTKTLCHGDFKASNILARHQNGKVTDIILVDYQLMKYNCLVNDLIYFIYTTTDRKFRNNHLDYLLNMYYESLKKYLMYFDMDAANVYPRSEFDKTFETKKPLGLMVAITYYPFYFASKGNVPDVSSTNVENQKVVLSQELLNRIEEIIEELDKWKLW